ncbi:hypothetical protein LPJ64_002668 [Coemansia asiatica]|uniref:MARVEL domain-containing protein n=1 Tax=Coemansia asiatica TaxID=1052880 RepID=A0A9W7XMA1_9FUNG|nr:hypothetical protein LPJ64_002668 [Coemansia asiatica]KAJ2853395.1 hypothetical protein FB639_006547 [Coemansia asiatica]
MGWHRLSVARKATICVSAVLSLGLLICTATAISEIRNFKHKPSVQHSVGWTLFVSLISLLVLPLLLTRSLRIQRLLNRTGVELSILGLLTLFYFISGITLATKSSVGSCITNTLCHRVRACTGFAWLLFMVLLGAMVSLCMIARVQSRLGLLIFSAYSFDIDGQEDAGRRQDGLYAQHSTVGDKQVFGSSGGNGTYAFGSSA